MNNKETLIAFIKEMKFEELKADWVIWALKLIQKADSDNLIINLAWLKAPLTFNSDFSYDNEPPMAFDDTKKIDLSNL